MLSGLVLVAIALRAGLRMRRLRTSGAKPERGLLAAHLRVARPAVPLLLAGFLGGPLSALLLREWTPFGTFHAWLGLVAATLFGTAGWLGLRMHRGRLGRDRGASLHGLLGTLGVLFGALAAAAGMVLLP
ncbi:MAG: hypothetical protein VCC67_15770 [Myxococcota bacterium]|jgi:hypothetical protein